MFHLVLAVAEEVEEEELVSDGRGSGCEDEGGQETVTEVRQEADDELAAAGIKRGELQHWHGTFRD